MNSNKAKEIREYLEKRLDYTLEWYKDCILCEETLINVRKDVASILEETVNKYKLKNTPFTLKTVIEDGFIVIRFLDKKAN